jgi:hypothetical protein
MKRKILLYTPRKGAKIASAVPSLRLCAILGSMWGFFLGSIEKREEEIHRKLDSEVHLSILPLFL